MGNRHTQRYWASHIPGVDNAGEKERRHDRARSRANIALLLFPALETPLCGLGNTAAPPLLLIHGGRDHARNWDWVALALRDAYHIIAPDLRGHGDSEWARGGQYAMIDYVLDMAQLLEQLQMFPITIIGHSLGGGIACQYSGTYPERVKQLVAIEGLGPPPGHTRHGSAPRRMREWIA